MGICVATFISFELFMISNFLAQFNVEQKSLVVINLIYT